MAELGSEAQARLRVLSRAWALTDYPGNRNDSQAWTPSLLGQEEDLMRLLHKEAGGCHAPCSGRSKCRTKRLSAKGLGACGTGGCSRARLGASQSPDDFLLVCVGEGSTEEP